MANTIFNPFTGNFDLVVDNASEIVYAPSTPAEWTVAPNDSAEALDSLAANKAGEVSDTGAMAGGVSLVKNSGPLEVKIKGLKAGNNVSITNDITSNNLIIEATGGGGGSSVEILNTSSTSLDLLTSPIVNTGNSNKELYLKLNSDGDQGQLYKANRWSSVAYGNGVYVALSETAGTFETNYNQFMRSTNGETWQPISTPADNSAPPWTDVTYGNGLFVAISSSYFILDDWHAVMTSPDGITWTLRSTPYDYDGMMQATWKSITYGNGLFVAVSNSQDGLWHVMTSPDGINWTPLTLPFATKLWSSITYGNGLFVAVSSTSGTQEIMTSPNGTNWTLRSHPQADLLTIAYGGGLFVAGGNYGFPPTPNILTSPDGINWTIRIAYSSLIHSIAYGNGIFIAVQYDSPFYQYSLDGITWTQGTFPTSYDANTIDITFGNGKFVVVGQSPYGYVLNSADGVSWTKQNKILSVFNSYEDLIPNNTFGGYNIKSITYGKGVWVAVAELNNTPSNSQMLYSLNNGKTWVQGTVFVNSAITSVTYGNGVFVGVANSSTTASAIRSLDGITWTAYTPSSNSWQSVTFGNNLFVAVASAGTNRVMTSSDGITWTLRNASVANSWRAVTWGNNLFVAVATSGTGNRVMTSPDGITWTTRTSAADSAWVSIAFGGGVYVAVATSGAVNRVMYSSNGTSWTAMGGNSILFSSVTYGDGFFYKIGTTTGYGAGFVSTSPNGVTWTKRNAIYHTSTATIAYGGGNYIVGRQNSWFYTFYSTAVQVPNGNVEGQTYELISTQESTDQYFVPKVIMPPTDGSLNNTFVSLFKNKRLELRWDSDAQKWY